MTEDSTPPPTQNPSSGSTTNSFAQMVRGIPLPPEAVMPLVHFYRAEASRENVWRTRLDTTTNWAVVTTTWIIGAVFLHPNIPHLVVPIGSLSITLFLLLEGRRLQYYDVWRARTRMLEAHFYVPMVLHDRNLLQGNWRQRFAEDLLLPTFKLSKLQAIGMRLKRNYIGLYLVLNISWAFKLFLDARRLDVSLYQAMAIDPLPSWIVAIVYGLFNLLILTLFIYSIPVAEHGRAIRPAPKTARKEKELWPM
ncbi:MAG: DUF2270 domain-containing protein [Planctomycetota bacterium]|nr:DUF2270 domain-containing protein [Planctomycetota bacterium]